MVAIATKFEVDSGDNVATLRFATVVELTAIAKSQAMLDKKLDKMSRQIVNY